MAASLASRQAWDAPAVRAERSAAAVIACPMPRRRQLGWVLTKITIAWPPKVPEPEVARTTPSSSTAAKSLIVGGSEPR